jgi:hypothetical protein
MILLANFKISEARLVGHHNRGNLKHYPDRVSITKYTLASYVSVLPLVSKVVLYLELDKGLEHHHADLDEFIRDLFPDDRLILKWKRNTKIQEWRDSYIQDIEPIDDDLIFNLGNDDHLFIDSDLKFLEKGLAYLNSCEDPYANLIYSHWPECTRDSANNNYQITSDKMYVVGRNRDTIAIDILKKARWKHYWFDFDFDDTTPGIPITTPYSSNVANGDKFFRTDVLIETGILPNGSTRFVPMRELVRHFDGYNNTADWSNLVPPLEIPEGFFEKNMRIAYGYHNRREGWININPAYPNYKAFSDDGMDYKFSLEDIPLAWHTRISEIDVNPNIDLEQLREERDRHLYDRAFSIILGKHIHMTRIYSISVFKDQFISKKWISIAEQQS